MKRQKIEGLKECRIENSNGRTTGCLTVVARETRGHNRQAGFTLVELVIVIAIVIILSVISVPIYRGYVDKSKMAEGYALLGTILSAQKAYYSQYGNFLNYTDSGAGNDIWTCNELVLGIDGRGNKYFTCFHINGANVEKIKWYFAAHAIIPEALINNGNSQLMLQYNITKGARIDGYPNNFDVSWRK